jgi:hypothetical protein
MARPNYAFAKRQRDLAKKQKSEEKRRRKAAEQRADTPAETAAPPRGCEARETRPQARQEGSRKGAAVVRRAVVENS